MLKTLFISAALVIAPSAADAEPLTEQRVVTAKDLDLSTLHGVRLLERRIAEACGEASNVDLAGSNAVSACRAEAPAKAAAATQSFRLAKRSKAGTIGVAAVGSH